MMAHQCNLSVGDFVWTGGDCHVYTNHLEQVNLQLTRTPYLLPSLVIKRKAKSLFDYQYEDFSVENYQAHAHIKGVVAV